MSHEGRDVYKCCNCKKQVVPDNLLQRVTCKYCKSDKLTYLFSIDDTNWHGASQHFIRNGKVVKSTHDIILYQSLKDYTALSTIHLFDKLVNDTHYFMEVNHNETFTSIYEQESTEDKRKQMIMKEFFKLHPQLPSELLVKINNDTHDDITLRELGLWTDALDSNITLNTSE